MQVLSTNQVLPTPGAEARTLTCFFGKPPTNCVEGNSSVRLRLRSLILVAMLTVDGIDSESFAQVNQVRQEAVSCVMSGACVVEGIVARRTFVTSRRKHTIAANDVVEVFTVGEEIEQVGG